MSEIRRSLESGFVAALNSGCECASQEELGQVVPMSVAGFQAMINDGTVERCPRHPGRFRIGTKGLRESAKLMRSDPEARRMLG